MRMRHVRWCGIWRLSGQCLAIEAKMPHEDRLLSAVSWFGQACSRLVRDVDRETGRTAQPRAFAATQRLSSRPIPRARRDDVAGHLVSPVARSMNGCMCGRP
jgi:hypothetical protein